MGNCGSTKNKNLTKGQILNRLFEKNHHLNWFKTNFIKPKRKSFEEQFIENPSITELLDNPNNSNTKAEYKLKAFNLSYKNSLLALESLFLDIDNNKLTHIEQDRTFFTLCKNLLLDEPNEKESNKIVDRIIKSSNINNNEYDVRLLFNNIDRLLDICGNILCLNVLVFMFLDVENIQDVQIKEHEKNFDGATLMLFNFNHDDLIDDVYTMDKVDHYVFHKLWSEYNIKNSFESIKEKFRGLFFEQLYGGEGRFLDDENIKKIKEHICKMISAEDLFGIIIKS